MSQRTPVATDKSRLISYCEPDIKAKLEVLADLRFRSLSNLVESILAEAVAAAEASGELNTKTSDRNTAKD